MISSRIKNSFGQCYHNKGTCSDIKEDKYVLDNTREYYLFDVIPTSAVRMTKSDTWKLNPNHPDPKKRQRKPVTKYFAFKNLISSQANEMGFILGNHIDAVFLVPMPDSWSQKKKEQMNRMPCKVRPDCDNYVKAVQDALSKEDGNIWFVSAKKVYSYRGSIILFR